MGPLPFATPGGQAEAAEAGGGRPGLEESLSSSQSCPRMGETPLGFRVETQVPPDCSRVWSGKEN